MLLRLPPLLLHRMHQQEQVQLTLMMMPQSHQPVIKSAASLLNQQLLQLHRLHQLNQQHRLQQALPVLMMLPQSHQLLSKSAASLLNLQLSQTGHHRQWPVMHQQPPAPLLPGLRLPPLLQCLPGLLRDQLSHVLQCVLAESRIKTLTAMVIMMGA